MHSPLCICERTGHREHQRPQDWRDRQKYSKWWLTRVETHKQKLPREPVPASVQFSSVAQSCPTLCDCMDYSTPGFPVHSLTPGAYHTHVHRVSDAIQPSHPLLSPSPPTVNLSQHQSLFQWVRSLHQVAKVLELQLQYQSFQWLFRTDFL